MPIATHCKCQYQLISTTVEMSFYFAGFEIDELGNEDDVETLDPAGSWSPAAPSKYNQRFLC